MRPTTVLEKVEMGTVGGCWQWKGAIRPDGYGLVYVDGTQRRAHRVVYEAMVGPISSGLVLDHLCRNRGCVNPDHLEPVTSRVNTLRGIGPIPEKAKQTHCVHGHAFSDENTYTHPKRGTRNCRTCLNELSRRRRAGELGTGECVVDGCCSPASSRQMCPSHYAQWWRRNRQTTTETDRP